MKKIIVDCQKEIGIVLHKEATWRSVCYLNS